MAGKNTEGYSDPTAIQAIGHVMWEERKHKKNCKGCNHVLLARWQFCPMCGKKVQDATRTGW